jgi:hypothetical protein
MQTKYFENLKSFFHILEVVLSPIAKREDLKHLDP